MSKIYISGKITGLDPKEAAVKFEQAEKLIHSSGCIPVNPLKISPQVTIPEWIDFMKADIKALMDCDAIYMLDNWQESEGAQIEYKIADMLKYQIHNISRESNHV